MTTPDQIVRYARTWLGAKWRHQGRGIGPGRGIDCAGLLIAVAAKFELPYDDMQGYRRAPDPKRFVGMILEHSEPGTVPEHGAFGIFTDTVQPCHVGIFAADSGALTLIHADAVAGRVREEPLVGNLKERLIRIRRFKEVQYE